MCDLVSLKGTKVNNIETRVGRFVFHDDSSVIMSTSDNEIDMADLQRLDDKTFGIIMSQGRRSVLPDSFEMLGFFSCVLQKYFFDRMSRMRRNEWQALTVYQYKRGGDGYEFQEYIFAIIAEEHCKIFG